MADLKKTAGFTLIEIIVTLAIAGILTSFAYPAYTDSVRNSRRTDAITTLVELQMLQEKHRSTNISYATDLTTFGYTVVSGKSPTASGYYELALSGVSGAGFTITATPLGDQTNDTACASFLVTQNGPDVSTAAKRSCWNQ